MSKILNYFDYRTYVFGYVKCKGCDHEFQTIIDIDRQLDLECPKCKKLKGDAYYIYLYKGKLKDLIALCEEAGLKLQGD